MPLRNPFRKTNELEVPNESPVLSRNSSDSGFQQTKVVGAKSIDIQRPVEYKLSEINDSGVYLPPSPMERSFMSRSSSSSNHRSLLNENEPFNISRESFDSFRRSFDISARSQVRDFEGGPVRQSLDSRTSRIPRTSVDCWIDRPDLTVDEDFEDVGLNDDVKPKKRSIFSRFGDTSNENNNSNSENSRSLSYGHHGFRFTNRKRAASGRGEELRSMSNQTRVQTPQLVV